jgi:hypothetical protein
LQDQIRDEAIEVEDNTEPLAFGAQA